MKITEEMVEFSILATIVLFAIYCALSSLWADGSIDYCWVEPVYDSDQYRLRGNRPWREDRTIANKIPSMEEGKRLAEIYGCPLK